MGVAADQAAEQNVRRGSAQKKKTVGTRFRDSLAALFSKLNAASPHFIRCVKPNKEKKPKIFTSDMAYEQLLNSGVMEAVRIRQQGFASRSLFAEFFNRYKVVLNT